jgi:hypothetical protein
VLIKQEKQSETQLRSSRSQSAQSILAGLPADFAHAPKRRPKPSPTAANGVLAMTACFQTVSFESAAAAVRKISTLKASEPIPELVNWCGGAAEGLAAYGDSLLKSASTWDEIKRAVAALSASACLRPATRALGDAERMTRSAEQIRSVLRDLALENLTRALGRMAPLTGQSLALPDGAAMQHRTEHATAEAATASHLAILDNIATYHREHERYYTVHRYESAADLAREANKLKVVADGWLASDKPIPHYPVTDFSQPAFRPAGCDDLNALAAIASIGILFMEGQGEPSEIRVLKGKLAARGDGSVRAGEWLAGMMAASWPRESLLLDDKFAHAARARYRTIATNWIGALEMIVVGRLLMLAVNNLAALDFAPRALRAAPKQAAEKLILAARIIEQAARLEATGAVELSGNDECWTTYREQLKRAMPV